MVLEKFLREEKIKFCKLSKVFHDNFETVSIILGFISSEEKKLETLLKISFMSTFLHNIAVLFKFLVLPMIDRQGFNTIEATL